MFRECKYAPLQRHGVTNVDHRPGIGYHYRRPVENWIVCSERLQPVASRSVEDEILGIVIIARQVRMKSDMRRST